jgi:serine/threonine-protein kinase RsbW
LKNKRLITRAAKRESLSFFRDFIEKECKQHELVDDNICFDLKLAVDEACTNIIMHGYVGMEPGSIILSLEMEPEKLIVTITDFGHPFKPDEPSAPNMNVKLEDWPVGGLGLFFIYQTIDEINYEATDKGNHVIFVKRLQTSGQNPDEVTNSGKKR